MNVKLYLIDQDCASPKDLKNLVYSSYRFIAPYLFSSSP
jgi:hypothetical protein